ncbi:MAG: hypothetical protein ACYYKD_10235 [Rhodospirillales bacterium]
MLDKEILRREVDQNYEAFNEMLPELLKTAPDQFVLLRGKENIAVFETADDAFIFAEAQYPDGVYSVQQITSDIVDLGYFSHVVG